MKPTTVHVLALTHQRLPLETVGRFHTAEESLVSCVERLRMAELVVECFVITTCNRAELVFTTRSEAPAVDQLVAAWAPQLSKEEADLATRAAVLFRGDEAMRHLISVASSLESLVVGEREILAQVRERYEQCRELGLTGDVLRLAMKQVVATAKRVYTETGIASRPVSVVSLAYRRLRELGVSKDARFLVIGAGKTCADMCRYLRKHGYSDLHIFNRTFSKADALTREVGGEAYPLDELTAYDEDFDVLISGIGRGAPVVDRELFDRMTDGVKKRRVLVDLAIPHDIAQELGDDPLQHLIRIEDLRTQAEDNKAGRQQEMGACSLIVEEGVVEFASLARERRVEVAMSAVPVEVRALRERTVHGVFADDLARLDPESRAVLDRVLDHLERKYISIPMKLAKNILLEETRRTAEAEGR